MMYMEALLAMTFLFTPCLGVGLVQHPQQSPLATQTNTSLPQNNLHQASLAEKPEAHPQAHEEIQRVEETAYYPPKAPYQPYQYFQPAVYQPRTQPMQAFFENDERYGEQLPAFWRLEPASRNLQPLQLPEGYIVRYDFSPFQEIYPGATPVLQN